MTGDVLRRLAAAAAFWWGYPPLPEPDADPTPGNLGSEGLSATSAEPSRVVFRRIAAVPGVTCAPGHGYSHLFRIPGGLFGDFAAVGECVRCPASVLFGPRGLIVLLPTEDKAAGHGKSHR